MKTLGVLALSMTVGTALLSWVHDLTPARTSATTLRGIGSRPTWDRIVVDTVPPRGLRADGTVRAFHHLQVDRDGRLIESGEWQADRSDPRLPGAIRIAVTMDRPSNDLTPRQWKRLADTVAHLQSVHRIARDRITVGDPVLASSRQNERLNQMLQTR